MSKLSARVESVHAGSNEDLSKEEHPFIQVELDGIVGDRHRSRQRETWQGDKQPVGTVRRNERQWSAVSVEELADISSEMELRDELTATVLGANLCLSGVPELSRLPKGTILKFPSGAELVVEEYNPPCQDMSKKIAGLYTKRSGETLGPAAFSKAAKLSRGVVGVVEVPGPIRTGDEVVVVIYETPAWLRRSAE